MSVAEGENGAGEGRARRVRVPAVIAIAVAVVVVVAAMLVVLLAAAVVAPPGVAAKYNFFSFVSEGDVSAYVDLYRTQAGYPDTDEGWAEMYAAEGTDADALRVKTIRQLIIDREIERKAAELGLVADDSEIDERVNNMRGNLAFDDDDLWQRALSMYGQTEEGLREVYRHAQLQDELCAAEVPVPEPTDEQVGRYLEATYPDGATTKHIYCFTLKNHDSSGGYDDLLVAQEARNQLVAEGPSEESFAALVQALCTDDDLVSRGGADGWDLDMDNRSEAYRAAVEATDPGEVSSVFRDDDAGVYGFVWIDTVFDLPVEDIDAMPASLRDYFSDRVAVILWQDDCNAYIADLYDASNPVIFPKR